MSAPEQDGDKKPVSGETSKQVFLSIADTTWRMFVPSIGMTFFGLWLDSKLSTTPWLMFAGIITGFVIAALAVRLQIKRLK